MSLARSDLESLLRTRRLDHTLTTALPMPPAREGAFDEYAVGATGIAGLDRGLDGGFPRGQLSEIVGPRSSGRASLLLQMLAEATRRGELVALIDVLDMFDVASAEAAGVCLDRCLWVRGHVVIHPGLCRDLNQRAIEQAIRALTLVLTAGHFGLVAFDAGDAPPEALRRLPFTTWLRLQRMVERSQTIAVLVGSQPMARSAAGLTVQLRQEGRDGRDGQDGRDRQEGREGREGREGQERIAVPAVPPVPALLPVQPVPGVRYSGRLFRGLAVEGRVVRARVRAHEASSLAFTTMASVDV